MSDKVVLYQSADGEASLDGRLEKETVWLSQAQMVDLFERDVSVVSRHIRNVFKEGELVQKSNLQKMQIANSDRPVAFYSLDVIISVGYRVKSQRGTQFRQWATRVLREHLVQGYTVNQQRMEEQAEKLADMRQAVELIAEGKHKVTKTVTLCGPWNLLAKSLFLLVGGSRWDTPTIAICV